MVRLTGCRMGDLSLWDMLLRSGLAVILGALIGWDRERHDKAAGIRTMALVSLGAAAVMMVASEISAAYSTEQVPLDPIRVISGVVGGVGFLGAGSIIQSGATVKGMTTAATIWVSAGIGVACGVGLFELAIVIAAFVLLVLITLIGVKKKMRVEQKSA